MIKWLTKEYWQDKMTQWHYESLRHKCLVIKLLEKRQLIHLRRYDVMTCQGDIKRCRWNKDTELFDDDYSFYKYEEVAVLPVKGHLDTRFVGSNKHDQERRENFLSNITITQYNPSEVNTLDIKEIQEICFTCADDNTQDDDIHEKLIEYFDKRGLSI